MHERSFRWQMIISARVVGRDRTSRVRADSRRQERTIRTVRGDRKNRDRVRKSRDKARAARRSLRTSRRAVPARPSDQPEGEGRPKPPFSVEERAWALVKPARLGAPKGHFRELSREDVSLPRVGGFELNPINETRE